MKKIAIAVLLLLVCGTNVAFAGSTPKPKPTPDGMSMNMAMPTPPPISGTAAMMGGTIFDAAIPSNVLSIPLQDASGKTFTLGSLKGRAVVLTDFFTSCDMICPMTTANMRTIGDTISAAGQSKKIAVLELSVDPKRDTVSRINAYQKLYGEQAPTWTVATGAVDQIKRFWSYFGVYTKDVPNTDGDAVDWQTGKKLAYDVEHDDLAILIDAKSHYRWIDLGNPAVANPNIVPSKLKAFLSSQGKLNLLHPQQPDWDPSAVYGAIQQVTNIQVGPKMKM